MHEQVVDLRQKSTLDALHFSATCEGTPAALLVVSNLFFVGYMDTSK